MIANLLYQNSGYRAQGSRYGKGGIYQSSILVAPEIAVEIEIEDNDGVLVQDNDGTQIIDND